MSALGAVLRDSSDRVLPSGGGGLADLATLDLRGLHPALADAHVVLASDVDNALLGPHGAVAVYGPQKGAVGATADRLEKGLGQWAQVVSTLTGHDDAARPGAGAAGGVGFAALALLGARMQPGIELLLDLVGCQGQGARCAVRHHRGRLAGRADAPGKDAGGSGACRQSS